MHIHRRLRRPAPRGRHRLDRLRSWLLDEPAGAPTREQRALVARLLRIAPR